MKQAWSKLLTFVEPGKKKIKADFQGLKEDISTDVAIIEDTDTNPSDVVANGRLDHIVSKGGHSYGVKLEYLVTFRCLRYDCDNDIVFCDVCRKFPRLTSN